MHGRLLVPLVVGAAFAGATLSDSPEAALTVDQDLAPGSLAGDNVIGVSADDLARVDGPKEAGFPDSALNPRGLSSPKRTRPLPMLRPARSDVAVEVFFEGSESALRQRLAALGATVTGGVPGQLVEARLMPPSIPELESTSGVLRVQAPSLANVPTASALKAGALGSEAVAKVGAAGWHAAGLRGAGVRVGIVDYFDWTSWNAGQLAGELPRWQATFCRAEGLPCSVWDGREAHGQAVAEVLHDLAPDAEVYLATAVTASDLRTAVEWLAANGVRVVVRAQTAEFDGPGDGTGPLDTVADLAGSHGIVWFNAAGNTAGDAENPGSYWRGPWVDTNRNGFLEFAPGDELLGTVCDFGNGLRWNDWTTEPTDYDLYVFDTVADAMSNPLQPEWWSRDDQTRGAPPLEQLACDGSADVDYIAISLDASGSGTEGDVLELMANAATFEHWTNPHSATSPISDSANPLVMSVGAIDPALGEQIGYYSARGPTNDLRTKPDMVGASCLSSYTLTNSAALRCFAGTSAATPVVAGAAALYLTLDPNTSPADASAWLVSNAVTDRGEAGPDNTFGWGELQLPPPPLVSADPSRDSDWDGDDAADIVAQDLSGRLRMYPGSGTGGFLAPSVIGSGWGGFAEVRAVGDLDGSGGLDLVGRLPDGRLLLYSGDGSGGFSSMRQIGVGWQSMRAILGPGDWNGDGDVDIIAQGWDGRLWFYPGNGSGGFGLARQIGQGWGSMTAVVPVGDWTGDGAVDLVARSATGYLWLYPGTGDGSFRLPQRYGSGWSKMRLILGVSDWDGDNSMDLVAVDSAGDMWLYAGDGSGGFRERLQIGNGWNGIIGIYA